MLEETVKPVDYEMSKWLLGIVSLLIGLFASQILEVFKKWWKNRELRAALREELEVLGEQVEHLQKYYSDEVQNYAVAFARGQHPVFPTCAVFEKLYPEILIKLKKGERLAYDAIHSLLNNIRERYDREVELSNFATATNDLDLHDQRGQIVQSQYLNCGLLGWRIRYAVENPSAPHLEGSAEAMKNLAVYREGVKKTMDGLIEEALTVPPAVFVQRKNYSSAEFYKRTR